MDANTGIDGAAGLEPRRKMMRGFAVMPREMQRQIASKGGRAAHQSGHAHEFTREEAREAGRKRHEYARQRASEKARSE